MSTGLFLSLFTQITDRMLVSSAIVKCAELYCRIWKEPPWNEDDWTIPIVLGKIRAALAKPEFIGFLAFVKDKPDGFARVKGFTWGFLVNAGEMAEISGNTLLNPLFERYARIFYLAELGVDSGWRDKGFGSTLSEYLIRQAKLQGVDAIVLRTDIEAIPGRKLYERLGFIELPITDQRFPGRSYWVLALETS